MDAKIGKYNRQATRQEVTQVRDMAVMAAEGNEMAAQWLYPMYPSLTQEAAKGLAMGLNTWLSWMTED